MVKSPALTSVLAVSALKRAKPSAQRREILRRAEGRWRFSALFHAYVRCDKDSLTATVYCNPMRAPLYLLASSLTITAALGSMAAPLAAQCLLCDAPSVGTTTQSERPAGIPLRISINTRLDFSRAAIANIGRGTIVVTPNGARTVSGNLEDLGGMGVAGTVEVWGSPNRQLTIDLPTTVELRAADGSVAHVTNFRTDLKRNPKLNVAGYLKFNFGAELNVTAGQAGQFRGRIPISVEYE